ncbi:MAG: TRAP transporter permease [Deltaproteobacteria bacterium]|jgi:TRAP transporter 4TM/12TM fusion protein|nr:TRAP transporter permease [Deltaproteobacteria bacterium]
MSGQECADTANQGKDRPSSSLAGRALEKEKAGETVNSLSAVQSSGRPDFALLTRYVIFFGCLAFALYQGLTVVRGMPPAYMHRPVHVMFAAGLAFLVYPGGGKKLAPLDLVFSLCAVAAFAVPAVYAHEISVRLVMVDELNAIQTIGGVAGLLLVLELVRRVVGTALAVVCVLFIAYAFLGVYMPGALAHKGFSWLEIVDYLGFGLEGLYSSAIGVSSTYIAAFIIFGTFLERCGAGGLLMDLGTALTGAYRGGPAKVAVLTSALFGTISGSAAANVYATGAFTIPMMKKTGYRPDFAGAVEAAASTGGQIMPPVMGAAAFIMADFLNVPYLEICKAAVIPAFLYFFSVLLMVDFEAAKHGLKGLPKEELPKLRDALKRLYLLLPVAVLLFFMFLGKTPFLAAILAAASAIVVSWGDRRFAIGPRRCLDILSTAGRRMILIAVACMGAGLVVGVVSLTGIGLNLASVVLSISGGSTVLALVVVMLSSLLMGMGTPTTVAYVLVATLGVPALLALGFERLPAHFFVFYFGVISMVTPPVAVAAYAGAEISGGGMMRTGVIATRLCSVAFVVPFFFMYDPALLMQGSDAAYILQVFATATAGTVALAGAMSRWFIRPLPLPLAGVLLAGAFTLIVPGTLTDGIGFALVTLVTVFCVLTGRKNTRPAKRL